MPNLFDANYNCLLLGMSTETFNSFKEKSNFRPRASAVWLAIYTLMTRNGFKKVSPSLGILCQMTSQSQSTVQRGLRELSEKGYLWYAPMYGDSGKWGVNYYLCLLPGKKIPEIPSDNRYISYNNQGVPCDYSSKKTNQKVGSYFFYVPKKDTWDDILSWHGEYVEMRFSGVNTADTNNNLMVNQSKNTSNKNLEEKENVGKGNSSTNFSFSPKVDHHSNYLGNINNIHNIHCDFFSFDDENTIIKKIEILKNEIKNLKLKDEEVGKQMSDNVISRFKVKDMAKAKVLLEEVREIRSSILAHESSIKYSEYRLNKMLEIKNQKIKILTDEKFLAKKEGKREISDGLFWWIKKMLFKFGVKKQEITLKMNEIMHAVRFGSHSHIKYNIHEEMPLMKSVNIALKLIREGKWQSPASFCYGASTY